MGNSYVKVKTTDFTIGFVYPRGNGEYSKVIVSMHPDHQFNKTYTADHSVFNSYGEWYTYDGDTALLHHTITQFDPSSSDVVSFLRLLDTACDLARYESVWTKVSNWAMEVTRRISEMAATVMPRSWSHSGAVPAHLACKQHAAPCHGWQLSWVCEPYPVSN